MLLPNGIGEIRTPSLLVPNQGLYQVQPLSLDIPARIRTENYKLEGLVCYIALQDHFLAGMIGIEPILFCLTGRRNAIIATCHKLVAGDGFEPTYRGL